MTLKAKTVFLITALCCILAVSPFQYVYAATPTPTPTKSLTAVSDAELERQKLLTKELSLNMPEQTEDPNYPVTFIDPSKQGVDITVDDKTTAKAPNPFLLPNLSIGEHKIIFKFKNKDGLVRVLTEDLLLIPKAPQFDQTLKTVVVRPANVALKGTTLPQSTVMLVVNSDKVFSITSTTDGKWEFIVPEPKEGNNNIIAFSIKNGIVSKPSKTFSLEYKLFEGAVSTLTKPSDKDNSVIAFGKTLIANIEANQKDNPIVFYGVITGAILIILVLVDLQMRKKAAKKRDEKTIASLFGTLQKDGGTIVDAIQSVTQNISKGKKKVTKGEVAKKSTKTKKVVEVVEEKVVESEPVLDASVVDEVQPVEETITPVKDESMRAGKFNVKKSSKKTTRVEVQKSEPLEVVDETEEPEKKVLTKEEFLKQFQKGGEQGE